MDKKRSLPVFSTVARKPSIDAARDRLGGRIVAGGAPPFAPGVIVAVDGRSAVVIFSSRSEVHVLLDAARLRRVRLSDVSTREVEVDLDLEKIAGDARLFGQLAEGEQVRYADDGGELVDAKIVEKCRWGALVEREDGAVIAVGFRKLWPLGAGGSA